MQSKYFGAVLRQNILSFLLLQAGAASSPPLSPIFWSTLEQGLRWLRAQALKLNRPDFKIYLLCKAVWVSYLTSLILKFPHLKRTTNIHFSGLLWGLNNTLHVECLAHNKYSMSDMYIMRTQNRCSQVLLELLLCYTGIWIFVINEQLISCQVVKDSF